MSNVNLEKITNSIMEAKRTFFNLALTKSPHIEVLGPLALAKEADQISYGFTDAIIEEVKGGNYRKVASSDYEVCGEIFGSATVRRDGIKALVLMMQLARAKVIHATNYSEGLNLDAWRVKPEIVDDYVEVIKKCGPSEVFIGRQIVELISPASTFEPGKRLHDYILSNYR